MVFLLSVVWKLPKGHPDLPFFVSYKITDKMIHLRDLHPGNIKLYNGELKFIDWGYSKSSLNLFYLSYIETIRCEASIVNEWWVITPNEAQEVLSAYFGAIGTPVEKIDQIHRAVMLWTKLWAYYNCVKYETQAEAERYKRNINYILETI